MEQDKENMMTYCQEMKPKRQMFPHFFWIDGKTIFFNQNNVRKKVYYKHTCIITFCIIHVVTWSGIHAVQYHI